METTIEVTLRSVDGAVSPGQAQVQDWSQKERLGRGLKAGAMCWGMAVVCVFIPLAHFILVPSLLIAGPVLFKVYYGMMSTILGGQAKCPKCGADFKIIRAREKWPLRDLCSQCQAEVLVDRKS